MTEPRCFRKIIRISAEDSPNVRYALNEQAAGREPSGKVLLDGVLTWDEYRQRRATWDEVRQRIGLDGLFWEGASVLLFPPDWLDTAERRAESSPAGGRGQEQDRWIGCDPAEGGDRSAWVVMSRVRLLRLLSISTPDTTAVVSQTLALMREFDVPAENVCFDRGGGGKEHADRMRANGHPVRTVAFGESLTLEPKRGMRMIGEKVENREERSAYKNRRAEMYGTLSNLLDPSNPSAIAIPAAIANRKEPGRKSLREQLAVIPKTYDAEGRLTLLPKDKPGEQAGGSVAGGRKQDTLKGLIGHSPDEADALVVAIHAMTNRGVRVTAGVS
jgi:hypothetical protein